MAKLLGVDLWVLLLELCVCVCVNCISQLFYCSLLTTQFQNHLFLTIIMRYTTLIHRRKLFLSECIHTPVSVSVSSLSQSCSRLQLFCPVGRRWTGERWPSSEHRTPSHSLVCSRTWSHSIHWSPVVVSIATCIYTQYYITV